MPDYQQNPRDPIDSSLMDTYNPTQLIFGNSQVPTQTTQASPLGMHSDHMTGEVLSGERSLEAALNRLIEALNVVEVDTEDEAVDDGEEDAIDAEDQMIREERLQSITGVLDQLLTFDLTRMTTATEKLADASRNRTYANGTAFWVILTFSTAKWRIPLGQSGILDSFLQIITMDGTTDTLMIHALRLIGNSCADTG